jgi:hypothetical protein
VLIAQKGGSTAAIDSAFSRYHIEEWENAERYALPYPRDRVEQFSPRSNSVLEIRSQRDLVVLQNIYANSVQLGDQGSSVWGIRYTREFDMTNDSKLFPARPQWEERGYRSNEYGLWIGPNGDIALPLYEGRMVGQFDFSKKGWVQGKGRTAEWRPIPAEHKVIEPQFCMMFSDYTSAVDREGKPKAIRGVKLGFMDVSSATNERAMVAALVPDAPCGNKVPVLFTESGEAWDAALCAVLNSFAYDYQLRCRLGGLTLNYFIIEETALPKQSLILGNVKNWLDLATLQLCGTANCFSTVWSALRAEVKWRPWQELWAVTPYERLRLRCILDALVADLYGLELEDLGLILQRCDYPARLFGDYDFYRTLDPKGFWRVDKEKEPELRHTVLTLVAFHELKRIGLQAFLALNDGEGWMLPETLRLADYGLGHDGRAKEAQPVTSQLGPRFLPWQLEQTAKVSWEECDRHAERLGALLGHPLTGATANEHAPSLGAGRPTDLFGQPLQTDLFGNVVAERTSRGRNSR